MDFEKLESALKNATAELDKAKEQFYKEVGLEVFEVVNGAKLRWTKKTPTVDGVYWMKKPQMDAEIVLIDGLSVYYMMTEWSEWLSELPEGCEWAGPIPMPQDAE